jgi:hypothetical protein
LDYDQIINALKDFGFKEIKLSHEFDTANKEMVGAAISSEKPLLAFGNNDLRDGNGDPYRFFRFCNKGKISKENPIFLLRISYNNTIPNTQKGFCTIIYPRHEEDIRTYNDFLEMIDNYF